LTRKELLGKVDLNQREKIMIKYKKDALAIVGGLSKPSKMPGFSIGLPIEFCKTGSKLRKVKGSVCEGCYAGKGCYTMYKAVGEAQMRRLRALTDEYWADAMVKLIAGQEVFRWHDSGDIQDMAHLKRIIEVCERTPETRHWIPTKEKAVIKRFLDSGKTFPNNLMVRVSSAMINGKPLKAFPYTSTVHTDAAMGHECPAPTQGGECRSCRACWSRDVANVSYHKH